MADEILEELVKEKSSRIDPAQLREETSRKIICDNCGTVVVGTPYIAQGFIGEYCDRDCFLLDLYRED